MLKIYVLIELERELDRICYHPKKVGDYIAVFNFKVRWFPFSNPPVHIFVIFYHMQEYKRTQSMQKALCQVLFWDS